MRFFFDNNLPPPLARAINELVGREHSVIHLREKFPASIEDRDWIETLAREGKDWVVLTRDKLSKKGTKGPPDREVFKRSGLTCFLLVKNWGNSYDRWELSWRLIQWWPVLQAAAESIRAGRGYLVPSGPPTKQSGKLEPLW